MTLPRGIQRLPRDFNLAEEIKQIEGHFIALALIETEGNHTKAAELLGIKRTTLVEKMKKYGMSRPVQKTVTVMEDADVSSWIRHGNHGA